MSILKPNSSATPRTSYIREERISLYQQSYEKHRNHPHMLLFRTASYARSLYQLEIQEPEARGAAITMADIAVIVDQFKMAMNQTTQQDIKFIQNVHPLFCLGLSFQSVVLSLRTLEQSPGSILSSTSTQMKGLHILRGINRSRICIRTK